MDADTIDTVLNDFNATAMAWYTALHPGAVAIPPNATPDQARAQVLAGVAPQAPVTALLTNQPALSWIGVAAVAVIVILLLKS